MSSYLQTIAYFFRLPLRIQWRTFLVQLPRYVPLSILHITSPKGPQPFIIALPSRKAHTIPIYVFVPPAPVDLGHDDHPENEDDEWKVPVVLDFHGGGFIMGSPLEQAPYCAMMSRELGAVVISVSYRIGPFNQFPSAIHDGEDVLSAILDTAGVSKGGKVLKKEIQRYYSLMREASSRKGGGTSHLSMKSKITLDPTRLCISGFSAGGNLALNLAISVPALTQDLSHPAAPVGPTDSSAGLLSPPALPMPRTETVLDDPTNPWPCILPPVEAQPRLIPLLLFYPSLDARLLPHERPSKPLPNALHGNEATPGADGKPAKPKVPGLFSIMSPTYLPKRLRAHPRASPGLCDPSQDIQKNAAIFLVLPEKDTLAVQSDVWVNKMNEHGWTGPVRFGDDRDHDLRQEVEHVSRVRNLGNGGLEVWHAPGCRHGWTQFPILRKHEKSERDLVFARTLDFVKENWKVVLGRDAV
ncbi:alpha/beta-hydrolase [Delitschia confertaspora ATCC 74209]|uniref:Alpha/beta-hydrolase n=1 Tax=Delitschia confertaspora ATCC 74209 TaxID=1513339 RepID=A0A9P4MX87_9PLEO|nr:alpha/beta-hydrolase [Delitschia confertaspora ATCC 74209]